MDRQLTYDVFVSNVDRAVSQEELSAVFERHGQVRSVAFVASKEGFDGKACFVRFSSEAEADDAMSALNGTLLNGRRLKISRAKKRGAFSHGSSENGDQRHQQQHQPGGHHGGHHRSGVASFQGRPAHTSGFRGGIRGGNIGSIRGGDRLPRTVGDMNHGQVGDSGSGGREDGHTTTSNGKQETEQHIPDVMMEGEQLQLEEEQPERTGQLMVTHVENGCMFWGMVVDTEMASILQQVTAKLQECCSTAEKVRKPISSQVYGAVFSEDNMFYRCRIMTSRQDRISVFFIDFGNSEEVAAGSLVMLPHELRSVPHMAQHFRLHGLQLIPSESEKATEYLKSKVTDKLLTAKFFKGLGGLIPVELIDGENQSLNKAMEELGLLKKQGTVPSTKANVPFKSRASVDSHHASDTGETTRYPNKEKIWSNSLLKDEANKEREIQRLTAELQRMSTEVEAQKEQNKSYVDDAFCQKEQHKQEMQDVEQQHEQEIKDINRLHEQEMCDVLQSVLQSKFEALVQQIKTVKTVRNGLPGGSGKDPLEVSIRLVSDDDSRISTNAIDTMQRVQEGVELLEKTQAEIKKSTVGETLDNLIGIRNATRKRLATSITEFLDHITSLPCDARSGDLVDAKAGILQSSIYGSLVQSGAYQQADIGMLSTAVDAYRDFKAQQKEELCAVQQATIASSEKLCQALGRFIMDLSFETPIEDGNDQQEEAAHLDDLFEALTSAVDDEVEESKRFLCEPNDCEQAAIIAVLQAIDDELVSIRRLRDELFPFYAAMHSRICQWLDVQPDVEPVTALRRHIKTLRRSLRHKEVHLCDLQEGDAADRSEISKIEQETADLRLQLHHAFEEEHNLLVELSSLSKEHFPEIPIQHPEMAIGEFEATGGLYRMGLNLEHYERHVISLPGCTVPVIKSVYCGQPCLLKEYNVTDLSAKGLEKEIVAYGVVRHPNLLPISAIFQDAQNMKVYVQTPYYNSVSLTSWLQDNPSLVAKYSVVTGLLMAISCLHSHSLVHGAVSPESVWVVGQNGEADGDNFMGGVKAVLTEFNFGQNVMTRAAAVAGAQGQSHCVSASFDVYCLGLLATKIFHGEMQQDPVLSDFVTKMLNASPVIRPRASDLLNHPYVLNPPEVVEKLVRIDEEDLSAEPKGELVLPDAVIDAQQHDSQQEHGYKDQFAGWENDELEVTTPALPDVSVVPLANVTGDDSSNQLAMLLGVPQPAEGGSSFLGVVSPLEDISADQLIDIESNVD